MGSDGGDSERVPLSSVREEGLLMLAASLFLEICAGRRIFKIGAYSVPSITNKSTVHIIYPYINLEEAPKTLDRTLSCSRCPGTVLFHVFNILICSHTASCQLAQSILGDLLEAAGSLYWQPLGASTCVLFQADLSDFLSTPKMWEGEGKLNVQTIYYK